MDGLGWITADAQTFLCVLPQLKRLVEPNGETVSNPS